MTTFEQPYTLFHVLPDDEMKQLFDPDNPKCPFYGYVGNRQAVDEMLEIARAAYEQTGDWNGKRVTDRVCPERIRLQGPPSAGKTSLVKRFAKLMGLPYIETDGAQIADLDVLLSLFKAAYEAVELPFEPVSHRGEFEIYEAPPTIVFVDEVHLAPGRVQDSLLKATEADDGLLILEGAYIDCRNVCFILGTTDGGKLRPAFKTRFQLVRLERHDENEVATIVHGRYNVFTREVCERIADLKPIPREALSLGKRVQRVARTKKCAPGVALEILVKRDGLMSGGMSMLSIRLLKLLAGSEGGLSKKNMCTALEIDEEELANDILPGLMGTDKHPAYVEVAHRHLITEEGRNFLKFHKS